MARLTLELPDELVASLRADAEKTHTTAEALLARHVAAYPPKAVFVPPPGYYASLWGAAAGGPGAHGSAEAANRYIRELRDEWDDR